MEKMLKYHSLLAYRDYLEQEERSRATIEKYTRDIKNFYEFLGDERTLDKSRTVAYKEALMKNYSVSSVNSMLAAVNGLLSFLDRHDCRVKRVKVQKQIFSPAEKELTKTEYQRLLAAAKRKKDQRLYLIMNTLCSTGIRVSELSSITVEAVRDGKTRVTCKGKNRMILMTKKMSRLLENYAKTNRISSGPVFVTRTGRPVDRSNIWSDMKSLCESAGVAREKVFPHNLRHLFARSYYQQEKDIVKLSDILGHSSVETTRLYTILTGREHEEQIRLLGLVL